MATADAYQELANFIDAGEHVLIGTHVNPDGDGIGSMLAMRSALASRGKTATLLSGDPIPDSLQFLPGADGIVTSLSADASFDRAILVDCAEPARAGKVFEKATASLPLAIVDHHLYKTQPDAIMCLDHSAASTGEVVWRFLKHLRMEPTPAIATCIYTTLVVDTGFFRYSNTTADVLRLAAELVAAGADPWTISRNLDESYPERRMRLLGASLKTLILSQGGRFASMDVTQEMLKETGAQLIDSDEFAIYPRSIKSVEVAVLYREVREGKVKVSIRSKDVVNVADIALRFGGGGHKHAAGFTLEMPLAEVKTVVEETVASLL